MPDSSWLEQMSQSAAGSVLGIALGGIGNKMQLQQEKKLNVLRKDMMDYQSQKQLEMWRNTNYPAQIEQMKLAGLNPGLAYGMSGGGGVTEGGNMPSGASAENNGGMGIQMGMAAAQMGLLQAQKANIEADTRNKEADTANKPKVGANLDAITAGQNLDNEFMKKSMEDRLDAINSDAALKIEELNRSIGATEQERRTREDRINQVKYDAANALIKSALMRAEIRKIGQDIKESDQRIAESKQRILESENKIKMWVQENMREWDKMDYENRRIKVQELFADLADQYVPMQALMGSLDMLFKLGNMSGGGSPTPIKGFKVGQ